MTSGTCAETIFRLALFLVVGACGGSSNNTVVFGGGDGGSPSSGSPDATSRDGGVAVPHDAGPDRGIALESGVADASGHDAGTHVDASPILDGSHDVASPGLDSGPVIETDGGSGQIAVVYGQSAGVLYAVNPNTEAVTAIGVFIGCDSAVFDIALNKDSVMYGTTMDAVYTISTTNAACTRLASGSSYPNSLSFVPAGTVDPNVEALVGYQGSTYVRIDTTTGALSTIGSLGGSTYTSSGDIVSVIGGGTYLTVTGGSDCSSSDCLVEVDPTTGALTQNLGSVHHSQVYGLAFWAGNVFGFDSAGALFKVAFPDAGGLSITAIPIPNPPLGLSFNGAGSTTKAPRF